MGEYSFKKDIKASRINEEIIKKFFESNGFDNSKVVKSEHIDNKDGDWSFEFDNKTKLVIECKEDSYCKKSNNLAIEYECRGGPSGILTTKSDFYVITAHCSDGFVRGYMIPVKTIREMIDGKKYWKNHENGGDRGSFTKNFLFNRQTIEERSRLLFAWDEKFYQSEKVAAKQ